MTWNVSVTDALAHSHPPVTLGSSGAAAAAEAPVEQTKDGKLLQLISQLLRHAHLYLSPQKPVDRLTARVSVFERPWKASFLSLNDIYKKVIIIISKKYLRWNAGIYLIVEIGCY